MALKNFIKTSDVETAKNLRNAGLYEVYGGNGEFVFVNSDSINFSGVDTSKIRYSDMLTF